MGFREDVQTILKELEDLLVSKNEKYGNSALEPKRIFSNADPVEQIKVRIDDKLSRMAAGTNDNEDTVQDLMGYLVLLKLAESKKKPEIIAPLYNFPVHKTAVTNTIEQGLKDDYGNDWKLLGYDADEYAVIQNTIDGHIIMAVSFGNFGIYEKQYRENKHPDTAVGEASIGISNAQHSESWKIEDALRGQRKWTFEGYGADPSSYDFERILIYNNGEPHYAFKDYEYFQRWVAKYPWSKDES